jgi:hypothetical protein
LSSLRLLILLMTPATGQGTIGGTLTADTTLGIADSPWTVTSPVTVPLGITLMVEAGVRVEFANGAQILIEEGRMVADGTEVAPIVFGRPEGATHTWDGLDLDGTDAFVSGNIFMNFRKDPSNTRSTTSNAIATGLPQTGAPNRTSVTAVRNLFLNCDHAVLLKEEAFLTAENNTFVGMEKAVIQFNETGGTAVRGPGKGAILEGNIFWDNAKMFKDLIETTELTVNHCLIDPTFHTRGIANFQGDPGFVDPVNSEDAIPLGSPVIGSGPNGINIGFLVSAGASISGEPPSSTWRTDATLVVDGPAIVQYRYRLNL